MTRHGVPSSRNIRSSGRAAAGKTRCARPTDQLRPVRLQLHALRGQQMYVAPPGFVIPRQAQGAASAGSPVRWPGVSLTPPERQQLRLLVRAAAQKDQKFADPVALSSTIPADGPASASRQSP